MNVIQSKPETDKLIFMMRKLTPFTLKAFENILIRNLIPYASKTYWILINYNKIGPVSSKDIQTPPLSFAPIFMRDAHSAESNEK